jgi:hypothetical protein
MKMIHRLRNVVFGTAVAATLAFGGTSALAAPASAAESARMDKYCGYFSSATYCAACCRGYPNYYWGGGECWCF